MSQEKLLQSVVRALDILELAANMPAGVRLRSLSRLLKVKRPALHNVLTTLAHKGFLQKLPQPGCYKIGPAALGLRRVDRDRDLIMKIAPAMLRISKRTIATVFLEELIGGNVISILQARPQGSGVLEIPEAEAMSLYGTGLVFQAFLSEEEAAEYWKRNPDDSWHTHLWHSQAEVDAVVAEARKTGVLVIDRKERNETFRVAAPIFGSGGRMIAALALCRPMQSTSKEHQQECIDLIRNAAQALSREFQKVAKRR